MTVYSMAYLGYLHNIKNEIEIQKTVVLRRTAKKISKNDTTYLKVVMLDTLKKEAKLELLLVRMLVRLLDKALEWQLEKWE